MREIASPKLSKRTTLHLGGNAIAELIVESLEDLEFLPEHLKNLGGKPFYIGKGSNLLADDGNLDIILIRTDFGGGIKIIKEEGDKALVSAAADASLASLLRFCLRNGLSGLEGLTGIPGSVGGAAAMNAGSFGTELASCLHSLLIATSDGIKTCNINELQPEYRCLKFKEEKEKHLIIEVIFALTKSLSSDIFKQMNLNFLKKKSGQPLTAWSAGCAFKNPDVGISAGKLLDQAGFRGKKLGGMSFSEKHANFLINEGKGSAAAAFDLLRSAQERVKKLFDVDLVLEVKIIS